MLIASVILSVAALAALELLSRSDAESLFARRQALASVEAERMLTEAAAAVKSQKSAAHSGKLDPGIAAEALSGCTATVREARETMALDPATRVSVVRVTAEIRDPAGGMLVAIDRVVPTAPAEASR